MDDSMIYQTASFNCTVEHSQLFTGFSSNDSKKLREPSLGNSRLCPYDVILSTHVFLCCKICSHSVQYTRLPCSANVFLFLDCSLNNVFHSFVPLKFGLYDNWPLHLAPGSQNVDWPKTQIQTSFKSLSEGAQLVQINSHYMRGKNWPKTDTR